MRESLWIKGTNTKKKQLNKLAIANIRTLDKTGLMMTGNTSEATEEFTAVGSSILIV